jgi:hypothetical protein
MNEGSNVVLLCRVEPQSATICFDSAELTRNNLDAINACLAVSYNILDRAAEFGGDAPALRVIKDLFAGLAYRLDEVNGVISQAGANASQLAAELLPYLLNPENREPDLGP